jgi:hypothetical protein
MVSAALVSNAAYMVGGGYRALIDGTAGLISHWRMGEPSGTAIIDAEGTNSGTYTGSPTLGVPGLLIGDPDTAVTFAAGQYATVKTGGGILAGLTNWTIEAWLDDFTSSVTERVLYSERSSTGNDILRMGSDSSGTGKVELVYRDDAGTLNKVTSTVAVNDGGRHLAHITKAGTAITMYVDGVAKGTGTLTATNNFTNGSFDVRIAGENGNPGGDFPGTEDEVAVYNVALSPATVYAHYSQGITYAFPVHPFSLWVGQDDLIGLVDFKTIHIEEAIGSNGSLEFVVEDAAKAVSLTDWAEVVLFDHVQDKRLFGGFVINREPRPAYATGRAINVSCVGYGILLDRIVSEPYDSTATPEDIGGVSGGPGEFASPRTHLQRALGQVVGLGQLTFFGPVGENVTGTGAPVNPWETVVIRTYGDFIRYIGYPDQFTVEATTLRQLAEAISDAAEVGKTGSYIDAEQPYYVYVDHRKRIWFDWVGEKTGNAPFVISDTPTGAQKAAEALDFETDSSELINSVYVKGSSPATSTWVRRSDSIEQRGIELMDVVDKSTEATSLTKARRYGRAFLADKRDPVIRGSFTITGYNGWEPRQLLTITNQGVGLSGAQYLIQSVSTRFLRGDGLREYEIAFGGSLRRSVARTLRQVVPQT